MPDSARPLLGSLALCRGLCTLGELDEALDVQRERRPVPRLGELLVDLGRLTPDQLQTLLREQAAPDVTNQPDAFVTVPVLARVHGSVGRLLPFLHPHRTYALLAALPGLAAIVLAWRLAKNGVWVHGVQGPGWPSFLLTAAAVGWLLLGDLPKALSRRDRTLLLGLSGLTLAVAAWKLFAAPEWAMAMGIGLPLALLSAAALPLCLWLMKAVEGDPDRSPPARLRRAWRDLSGKRAKEKAELLARRDALLKTIGEAALRAGPAPDDPEPLRKARSAVDAGGKPLPGKRERALLRLGRAVVDAGLAEKAAAEELRSLDARVLMN